MSEQASTTIRRWLRTANTTAADIEHLRLALADAEPDLGRPIADPSLVVAAAFGPASEWHVFVPVEGAVVAIVTADDVEFARWDEIAADTRFWLTPSSRLAGLWDDPSEIPFAFDADSWCGTTADEAFGDSEWVLIIDDNDCTIDLKNADLRYSTVREASWPAGIYIDIDAGGTSMSTGDIGMSVAVDAAGNIWSSIWGCEETFHGRADADFSPYEWLPASPSEAVALFSSVFTPQQMRELVDYVADCVDEFDDQMSVKCVGFEGTAAQLITVTMAAGDG